MKKLRVGVIYGGRSGEHEVSVASAASVFKHLDRDRYDPVAIRIEKDGRWALVDKPPILMSAAEVIDQARLTAARPVRPGREAHMVAHPGDETLLTIEHRTTSTELDQARTAIVNGLGLDVIFPVLHGPLGEDGTVQGLLELANVPYVRAGVLGSAVGMDKAVMKTLFAANGLPIGQYLVTSKRNWERDRDAFAGRVASELGFPVFVKPANLGSSVGISKATTRAELTRAVDVASDFDRKIVVEAAVPNAREIECAVLGNDEPEASVPGEIIVTHPDGFYSYDAKYVDASGASWKIPADIPQQISERVRRLSVEAFRALDLSGMARVDFLLERTTGALYLNEVNTIPGFTTISMYPKMWEATGVPYSELLDRLIALALERHAEKQQFRTSVT